MGPISTGGLPAEAGLSRAASTTALGLTPPSDSCSPAPYGQACVGCSRAKCKCFYRPGGSECERCHRLGKVCEPSTAVRKRKRQAISPPVLPAPTRLEEKLDDLVSLLRSQVAEKQAQAPQLTTQSTPIENNTPSVPRALVNYDADLRSSAPAAGPDVVIDTTESVIHLLRAASPPESLSPIFSDVLIHEVPNSVAEERLAIFRRAFISVFPFVYIPSTLHASELRHQKPFLWLVVMSLATKSVSEQFAMEETIWRIISQRIVSQHFTDLDLLLGVICFASWSHYFKQDKPFMTKLSQLAVSLAFDLGLQNDVPTSIISRSKSSQSTAKKSPTQHARNMEERRSIIALFHLTSSTWIAYRKTEPLRWTPYMDGCLRILSEGNETHLDIILATQVKCHIISNQLTCAPLYESMGGERWAAPTVLTTALLSQLNDIRQKLPANVLSDTTTRFYLYNTELTIQESRLSRPKALDQSGISNFQRLQDLDSALTIVQRWFAVLSEYPRIDWVGINVDYFAQLTHFLVVLFKLTTLDEPGWDLEEVKRRADLFDILDRFCETLDGVPVELGMVDVDGPRQGLFFKATHLLRSIRALFLAEMPSGMLPNALPTPGSSRADYNENTAFMEDFSISEDFVFNLADEPWLSDIFGSSWDFRPESSADVSLAS